ncbi:kinesin-like protein KIF23, partial [Trichonephila clavipes]
DLKLLNQNMGPSRAKTPKKTAKFKATVKDPIVVYCRIRPLENPYDQICVKPKGEKTVVLFPPDVSQNSKIIKEVSYLNW